MATVDITTEDDIKTLVDSFYKDVVVDPFIGYIFTEVVALSWELHMPIMYSFWSSMLLGTRAYSGSPMTAHIALDKKEQLTQTHFDRWIELWVKAVNFNFSGPIADQAIQRAQNIAPLMLYKVEQSRDKAV